MDFIPLIQKCNIKSNASLAGCLKNGDYFVLVFVVVCSFAYRYLVRVCTRILSSHKSSLSLDCYYKYFHLWL